MNERLFCYFLDVKGYVSQFFKPPPSQSLIVCSVPDQRPEGGNRSGAFSVSKLKNCSNTGSMLLSLRGETMNKKKLIAKEIEQVPEPLLEEVLDFVRFLKNKCVQEKLETSLLSESSLKKDWLRPEEDEAWKNL